MERTVTFEIGNFYHVYNRGVDKMRIFRQPTDYIHFQKQLFTRNSDKRIDSARVKGVPFNKIDRGNTIVDVVAYALMPNHFHVLLHEKQRGGISTFMNKLGTAHAMYFNTKYERSGPLMCRPFRAKHVDSDEYFRLVFSYIHLNPCEIVANHSLGAYPYSSYPDYYEDNRAEAVLLNKAVLPIDSAELEDLSVMKAAVLEADGNMWKEYPCA